LTERCIFLLCHLLQEIHYNLIRFKRLWSKSGNDIAKIRFSEFRILIKTSCEKTLAQRTKRYKTNSEFLKCWY
jgi:hypothetical protein